MAEVIQNLDFIFLPQVKSIEGDPQNLSNLPSILYILFLARAITSMACPISGKSLPTPYFHGNPDDLITPVFKKGGSN
jgi:hypothetical protein